MKYQVQSPADRDPEIQLCITMRQSEARMLYDAISSGCWRTQTCRESAMNLLMTGLKAAAEGSIVQGYEDKGGK